MRHLLLTAGLAISILASAQEETTTAFSLSYSYENAKQYSKAIAAINNVYTESSYTMNTRLGWLYYMNGDYVKSQSFYKKALALKPRSIEGRLGLAYPTAALNNWNDVIANYKAILKIDPNHSLSNYRLAYIYYTVKKENETAINYLNKVLEMYPFDYDSNYLMAKIHVRMGNIKEAKEAIIAALQYNPSSTAAWAIYETVK